MAAAKGHRADLAKLPPVEIVGSRAARMAQVIAIFAADEAKAKATLERDFMLFEPFAYSLFLEIGALAAFGYGFSHRRRVAIRPANDGNGQAVKVPASVTFPALKPVTVAGPAKPKRSARPAGNGYRNRYRPSKAEAERVIVTRLAKGVTVPAQQELVTEWGVSNACVSRWLAEWEWRGVIPARQVEGRCKTVGGNVVTLRRA